VEKDFVRALMGPIGSGKSVGCCIELLLKAIQQEPNPLKIRKTRWAIIRNTYRELIDTTMNTFFDWIPQDWGVYKAGDMKFTLKYPVGDGTSIEAEFLFRALDKPDDIKKLLSLELTGGWINEAREIPKAVMDMLIGRLGRYPSARDGGPTWFGLIMDTNPPDSDHWWYTLFEETRPKGYKLYRQPGGREPNAENIENLPPNYYENMLLGKDSEWVNVYVNGQYGFIADGMMVHPQFNPSIHVANDIIEPDRELPLWVGLDFGRTPAAEFAQQDEEGQWRFIDEICTTNMGADRFAVVLGEHLRRHYRGFAIEIYGDPAGSDAPQTGDDTPFDILYAAGIDAQPAPSQDPDIRRGALSMQLTQMTFSGQPRFLVSPKCKMLVKGLSGGFKYRRMQIVGEDRYQNVPDKNRYSHPCEAAEYLLVGAGEDVTMIGEDYSKVEFDYSTLNRAAV
jgi:hypothetical protein